MSDPETPIDADFEIRPDAPFPLRPTGQFVLIRPDEAQEVSEGGIIEVANVGPSGRIHPSRRRRPQPEVPKMTTAEVVAVGPGAADEWAVGDRCIFIPFAYIPVDVDGDAVGIIKAEDLLCHDDRPRPELTDAQKAVLERLNAPTRVNAAGGVETAGEEAEEPEPEPESEGLIIEA